MHTDTFEDRPRPDAATLAVPLGLAIFFSAIAAMISLLALFFLPPQFWLFIGPVLGLCGAGLVLAVRRLRGLQQLVYRIDIGRVTVAQGRDESYVFVSDLSRVAADPGRDLSMIPSLTPVRAGATITRSARGFENRARGIVYLEAGGEWLRFSPTDPSAFLAAVEREIRGSEHAESTCAQPSGDEPR